MLRALWTWQRWIGVWRPKVLRIALDSALAPSMMNRRDRPPDHARPGCAAPAPRRYSRSPPRSRRGDGRCVDADGGQRIKSSSMWMARQRSRLDRSAAIRRSADNATNRRDRHPRSVRRGHVALPGGPPNLRGEVDHRAHLPSGPADNAASQLGRVTSPPSRRRTRGRSNSTLPPWKPTFPVVLPQRCPSLPSARSSHTWVASSSSMLAKGEAGRGSKLAPPGIFDDCRRDNSGR